ncbi:HET domain-containing protein [Microdochium nivale]|nr:HET domain-containing protein [Microdochium nivale]
MIVSTQLSSATVIPYAATVMAIICVLVAIIKFSKAAPLLQDYYPQHRYKPLEDASRYIRLLRWVRDDNWANHGVLRFDLTVVPIAALLRTRFFAVSYTWETPFPGPDCSKVERQIIVDGELLTLSENVSRLLHSGFVGSVAREGTPIFIDAICIDQNNETEKQDQLPLLVQIYSNATQTIAWLGSNTCRQYERPFPPSAQPPFLHQISPDILRRFVCNPYWQRLWIVPEFLLSGHTVFCIDDACIKWTELSPLEGWKDWQDLLSGAGLSGTAISEGLHSMLYIMDVKREWETDRLGIMHGAQPRPLLLELIRRFSVQACKDDRDRVYAMLPLLHQVPPIQIRYDATTLDVLREAIPYGAREMSQAGRSRQEIELCLAQILQGFVLSGRQQGEVAQLVRGEVATLFP